MKILVFSGAGISAESGIPTFRSSDGLWENHRVEDVASLKGFEQQPQVVWSFYRERYLSASRAEPNDGHFAIAKLQQHCQDKGIPFLIATQNVDGLHQRAGAKDVIELHGSVMKFKCSSPACDFTTEENLWVHETIPVCTKCLSEYMRPDIVWFGEELPFNDVRRAFGFLLETTHVLVVGTSMQVFPAADLVLNGYRQYGAHVIEFNPRQHLGSLGSDRYDWIKGGSATTLPLFVEHFTGEA